MVATLQERLNDLVNFSSQLIFVGGESLTSQTKSLETMLFQQSENTEIAYIVAEPDMSLVDFRQQLCQQLLGQPSQFYHRPLNECLASLNTINSPIMVAITRAEFIPHKLLQELWELVLQSRFAGNKQHLNVVLFADKKWAIEAKKGLPDNHTGSPLLLSTKQAAQYKHASEPLSSQGNYFHSSNKERKEQLEHDIEQRPLILMKAFWVALALIVLSIVMMFFVGQRGEEVSALFQPLSNDLSNPITIPKEAKTPVSTWKNNQTVITANQSSKVEEKATSSPVILTETVASTQPLTVQESKSDPQPVQKSDIVSQRETLPPNNYIIQIAGFKDLDLLTRFVKENGLENITQIYTTKRYDSDWHVIISKKVFPNAEEARDAITTMPSFATRSSVFIKSTDTVLNEKKLAINEN